MCDEDAVNREENATGTSLRSKLSIKRDERSICRKGTVKAKKRKPKQKGFILLWRICTGKPRGKRQDLDDVEISSCFSRFYTDLLKSGRRN